MPVPPLLAAYVCFASLALEVLAFLLYVRDRHCREIRCAAVVTFLLMATSLAFAPLLLVELSPTAKAAFKVQTRAYADAYAREAGHTPIQADRP